MHDKPHYVANRDGPKDDCGAQPAHILRVRMHCGSRAALFTLSPLPRITKFFHQPSFLLLRCVGVSRREDEAHGVLVAVPGLLTTTRRASMSFYVVLIPVR